MNARIVVRLALCCAMLASGCAYQVASSEEEALDDVEQQHSALSSDETVTPPAGATHNAAADPQPGVPSQDLRDNAPEASQMPAPPPPWEESVAAELRNVDTQ